MLLNTLASKVGGVVASTVTLVNDSQLVKAEFPIFLTLLGIVMLVNDSQLAKAKFPIFLTEAVISLSPPKRRESTI